MQDVMVHKHYISVSDWHCQLCKNDVFYQYFEGDSPILLLWFMLLAYNYIKFVNTMGQIHYCKTTNVRCH